MELEDRGQDPFSSESLWRLSTFTLQGLQPLEPLHLDDVPGECPRNAPVMSRMTDQLSFPARPYRWIVSKSSKVI